MSQVLQSLKEAVAEMRQAWRAAAPFFTSIEVWLLVAVWFALVVGVSGLYAGRAQLAGVRLCVQLPGRAAAAAFEGDLEVAVFVK